MGFVVQYNTGGYSWSLRYSKLFPVKLRNLSRFEKEITIDAVFIHGWKLRYLAQPEGVHGIQS